jgi:hypothetical protein
MERTQWCVCGRDIGDGGRQRNYEEHEEKVRDLEAVFPLGFVIYMRREGTKLLKICCGL